MKEETNPKSEWVISYKQLGALLLTFAVGFIGALLLSNANTAAQSTFTTTELIGFVLSVVLSGASIVLAVAAIALGKSSEQAVIRRSDESIKLQTEVFTKTTDALQRIESSTGVTEKRIEDIISGRVGDISHEIAQMATKGEKQSAQDIKQLEENIRKSILRSVRTEDHIAEQKAAKEAWKKKQEEEQEREDLYQRAHRESLLAFGNKDGVKISKFEHGSSSNDGEDLFDGLFQVADQRVAVSTFRPESALNDIKLFITNAGSELAADTVKQVYLLLFQDEKSKPKKSEATKVLATMNETISSRIEIVELTYSDIPKSIDSIELQN